MISKPEAYCLRCRSKLTVLDPIEVGPHAETVTYYCECDCGAADMTITRGEISSIVARPPMDIPEYFDEPPEGEQEYEGLAQ